MKNELTADRVEEIFHACRFQDGEDVNKIQRVESLITTTFNKERLLEHRSEIEALIDELPDEFRKSKGGGASFLNACMDRNGKQWTGSQLTCEHLLQLGIAILKVELMHSREHWSSLPGGVPHYVINF